MEIAREEIKRKGQRKLLDVIKQLQTYLRVAQGITLEQLAEQTNLSKSALGSYETEEHKDISHFAILSAV